MIASQSTTIPAAIASEIVRMTEENWGMYNRALLLAKLGQTLTRHGHSLKPFLRGKKLTEVIREELSDKLEIITSPTDELVHALVPKGASLVEDRSIYFSAPPAPEVLAKTEANIRFASQIWAAFSRALPEGRKRIVQLEPSIHFVDIPKDQNPISGLEVPEEMIVRALPLNNTVRDAAIADNIARWAKNNSIPLDLLKAPVTRREIAPQKARDVSILDVLLASLEPGDLKRVSVPLDLVLALSQKKVNVV